MAGSIERRVARLEGLERGQDGAGLSQTEEARAIEAEIREVEEEMRALGADPDEWRHAGDRPGLSLEGHIAALENEIAATEKELGGGDDH